MVSGVPDGGNPLLIVIQGETECSEDVLLRACPKNLGNIH